MQKTATVKAAAALQSQSLLHACDTAIFRTEVEQAPPVLHRCPKPVNCTRIPLQISFGPLEAVGLYESSIMVDGQNQQLALGGVRLICRATQQQLHEQTPVKQFCKIQKTFAGIGLPVFNCSLCWFVFSASGFAVEQSQLASSR